MLRGMISCRASASLSSASRKSRVRNATKTVSSRNYAAATSREKRALNSKQIKGDKPPVTPVKAASNAQKSNTISNTKSRDAAVPDSATTSVGGGGGGGESGGGMTLPLLVILGGGAAAVGAAYYNDMLPSGLIGDSSQKQKITDEKIAKSSVASKSNVATKEKEIIVVKEEKSIPSNENKNGDSKEIITAKADISKETATKEVDTPVAESSETSEPSDPIVTTESQAEATTTSSTTITTAVATVVESSTPASAQLDESKIMAEIDVLKKELRSRSDKALNEAHSELAKLSSLDMMSEEIDKLTNSQLKVRLIQMAKDREEQTKWEAVRLQEFLSMKEKEVEDRYVLLIKKLRLEAEHLQDEKLAQQRKVLITEAEEALKEQQTRSDAFLENSMKIQEKAHEDDKIAFEKKTEEATSAKYEEMFGTSIAKIKDDFATKMSQRTQQMEQLSKNLSDLESSLKTSQDFQVGSLQAHRITAAAIALTEKLESGEPSGAAVNALEAVASDNAVVSAAVKALPDAVSNSGLMTIQELQAKFEEKVFPQCRRAANIPEGRVGLEGQLLGSFFSMIRFSPDPDEAAPESEKDTSEYVLSRARRYVQLGELDKAVTELDKLKGQAAYTAKDWKTRAKDRVAVDKSLKVIRMECALANENLSKSAA